MMVYRSLVVGLLGAIALLLANRPPAGVLAVVPNDAPGAAVSVVDVSRQFAPADPTPLLGLCPGERVVDVDGNTADGVTLAARWRHVYPGEYVDVGIAGANAEADRRILVLFHR